MEQCDILVILMMMFSLLPVTVHCHTVTGPVALAWHWQPQLACRTSCVTSGTSLTQAASLSESQPEAWSLGGTFDFKLVPSSCAAGPQPS